jgi:hypothetical protein
MLKQISGFGITRNKLSFWEMAFRAESDGVYLIRQYSDIVKAVSLALTNSAPAEAAVKFREDNS